MLTKNAISAAMTLSKVLGERGLYIEAAAGTPLRLLVDQCGASSQSECECIPDTLLANSGRLDALEQPRHDLVLQDAIAQAATAVRNNINYARNVVNPLIRTAVENIKAKESSAERRFSYGYNVVPFSYADFWELPGFVAVIEKYSELPAGSVTIPLGMTLLGFEELKGLITSGISSIDKAIAAYVDEMGPEYLDHLYRTVFLSEKGLGSFGNLYTAGGTAGSIGFLPDQTNANHLAIVHFMAKALQKSIPDAFSVDAKDYEQGLSEVIGQTGRRLALMLETRRRDASTGRLVFSYMDKVITVNNDVYSRFLENGGSVDIVIGSACSDQVLMENELSTNADRYNKAHQTYVRTLVERDTAEYHARTVGFIGEELIETLKVRLEEGQCTRNSGDALKEIKEHLSYVSRRDLDNLWVVVRKLICHCFFYGTNVQKILCYMDDIGERMPSADPRLLAYYAEVELLCDWIAQYLQPMKA